MSRRLGAELPPQIVERLSGRELERAASKVIQLVTVDAGGWPHPALLSYFEVVVKDAGHLRLATWRDSTTSANMRRAQVATLVIVDERLACYVKTRATERAPRMRVADWNAAFDCEVQEVLLDEVDQEREPGAYLASGISYVSPRRDADLERGRRVIAELLEQ